MVSIVNANKEGLAPSGLSPGSIVNTKGGSYLVTAPGTVGSTYNPKSGYWSQPLGSDLATALAAYSLNETQANTARSQAMAERQMSFQTESNAQAMAFSAAEAEKNREFQRELSNSAHQREVRDLIAAGLNPILSAGGSGATTPSGAAAAGVTSAGSQGTVDMNQASILNNLITGMFNRDVNKYAVDVNAQLNKYLGELSAEVGLSNALTSAQAAKAAAGIAAAATRSVAEINQQTGMYQSDQSYRSVRYQADKAYESRQDTPDSWAGLASRWINKGINKLMSLGNPNTAKVVSAPSREGFGRNEYYNNSGRGF